MKLRSTTICILATLTLACCSDGDVDKAAQRMLDDGLIKNI